MNPTLSSPVPGGAQAETFHCPGPVAPFGCAPLLISDLSSWFCSFSLKFFILQGLATTLRPSSVQLDFWKSKGLSPESCAFFLSFPLLPPISPLLLKLLFQKPRSQPVKPPLPVDTLFYFFFLLCPLPSGPQRSCLLLLDLL